MTDNTPFEYSETSLDDFTVGTDAFNWDFLDDGANNANNSELFSVPSNSPPVDAPQKAPAAQAAALPALAPPIPENVVDLVSNLFSAYPDLRNYLQASGTAHHFAAPQQIANSYPDPASLGLRQMAAPAKRISFGPEETRRQSSKSTSSGSSTARLPPREFRAEKPKPDPKKSWHRINLGTRGLTKRTGKINQYDPEEMYKQNLVNPFGRWRSPNHKFTYHEHGELGELEYSADAIKEFIYHHPVSADSKLRLWIQKTPADSCRRYPSHTLSKCRFRDCPSRRAGLNGTIYTGHIRVAADERSYTYKDKADPFYAAGYFHLYCFEKFLDLPEICQLPNVEVLADMRQLANEPNMKWSASLSTAKEGIVARRFIQSCSKGHGQIRDFPDYPRPHNMVPGAEKVHEHMLNYRMQKVKEGNRQQSSKESLARRPLRETQVNVNFGDLEIACRAKVAQRKPQAQLPPKKKRTKRRLSSFSEAGSNYVSEEEDSEEEAPVRNRKKRRVEERTPTGPFVPTTQSAFTQANTTAVNDLFGPDYPMDAWQYSISNFAPTAFPPPPAPMATPAPHATQISNAVDPSLDALFQAPAAPQLPDYSPVFSSPPAPATVTHSLTVPSSFSLTDFTLAQPTKRSAPADNDDIDQSIAAQVKRHRSSVTPPSNRTPSSACSPTSFPRKASAAARTTRHSSSSASAGAASRRRSERLSSAVSVAEPDNGKRRSLRLAGSSTSGTSFSSSLGSLGPLGSMGSLFEV